MLDFPDTPVDGEQSTQPNGITYVWQAAKTRWVSAVTAGSTAPLQVFINGVQQDTTSGDEAIFPIPSGVKSFTMMMKGVTLDGDTSNLIVRLHNAGGAVETGYESRYGSVASAAATEILSTTTGLQIAVLGNGRLTDVMLTAHLQDEATNLWHMNYQGVRQSNATLLLLGSSTVTLTSELTAVKLSVAGANLFDGGSVNVQYDNQGLTAINNDFDMKLAGYLNTGLHEEYTGDLNNILANSVYSYAGSTAGNAPSTANGIVETHMRSTGNSQGYQITTETNANGKVYQRTRTSGNWGAWVLVVDGGAFTERLRGYGDNLLIEAFADDLNTILINSTFLVGPSNANLPADWIGQGFCTTSARDINNATQMLWQQNQPDMKWWCRKLIGGAWGAWQVVVDGNDGRVLFGRVTAAGAQDRDNGGVTVAPSGTAGEYVYTFDTPRAGIDYTVQVTPGVVGAAFAAAYSFTTVDFKVRMYNTAGTNTNLTHAYAIHIQA